MSKNPKDQMGNVTSSDKSRTQTPTQQNTNWDDRNKSQNRDSNPNPTTERRNPGSGEMNRTPENDRGTSQRREEKTSENYKDRESQPENFRKTSIAPGEREFDDNDHPHTFDKPYGKDQDRDYPGMENESKRNPAYTEKTKGK